MFINIENNNEIKKNVQANNGVDVKDRIKEGKETYDELADAKRYLNYVLLEISNMKSSAIRERT
jgi:hypothetical protein